MSDTRMSELAILELVGRLMDRGIKRGLFEPIFEKKAKLMALQNTGQFPQLTTKSKPVKKGGKKGRRG